MSVVGAAATKRDLEPEPSKRGGGGSATLTTGKLNTFLPSSPVSLLIWPCPRCTWPPPRWTSPPPSASPSPPVPSTTKYNKNFIIFVWHGRVLREGAHGGSPPPLLRVGKPLHYQNSKWGGGNPRMRSGESNREILNFSSGFKKRYTWLFIKICIEDENLAGTQTWPNLAAMWWLIDLEK